jgi:hypothetical protein
MNTSRIKVGSIWEFDGRGGRKGLRHVVTSCSGEGITTWSEPSPKAAEGGDSWFGKIYDFLCAFRQVKPDNHNQ